jgi:hypothetical protein
VPARRWTDLRFLSSSFLDVSRCFTSSRGQAADKVSRYSLIYRRAPTAWRVGALTILQVGSFVTFPASTQSSSVN